MDDRPLAAAEESPYLNPHELVSLSAGKDNTWLDSQIEKLLLKLPQAFSQVLTPPSPVISLLTQG
jgi:hypothetical protein